MNYLSVEINFECWAYSSAFELWTELASVHNIIYKYELADAFSSTSINKAEFISKLRSNNENGFHFRVGDGEVIYNNSSTQTGKIGHLTLRNIFYNQVQVEESIGKISLNPKFISARTFDSEYEFWQNQTDIDYFIRKKTSYEHLPLKSNGLPPPLDRTVIDISKNPGRCLSIGNFVEAIGSTMWLGERFWQVTGTSKDDVLSSDQFEITESNGVVKVVAQDTPFTDWKGEQGERQNQLRKLLFRV